MQIIQVQQIRPTKSLVFYKENELKFRLPVIAYTGRLVALTIFGKSLEVILGITALEYSQLPNPLLLHPLLDLLVGKYFLVKRHGSVVTYIESVFPLRIPTELLFDGLFDPSSQTVEGDVNEGGEWSRIYETDSSSDRGDGDDTVIPATPTLLPTTDIKEIESCETYFQDEDTGVIEDSLIDALYQFQLTQS